LLKIFILNNGALLVLFKRLPTLNESAEGFQCSARSSAEQEGLATLVSHQEPQGLDAAFRVIPLEWMWESGFDLPAEG
jgi:hypothetical protein